MASRRNVWWLVLRVWQIFIPLFLVVSLVGWLDLFRLRSQTEDLSRTLFLQLLAPFYPEPGGVITGDPHAVTVITLDRSLLARLDTTWPLSFREYAYLVRRIGQHQPRVLFLDLFFVEPRGDAAEIRLFVHQLERIRENGTAVVIAAPNPCLIDVYGNRQVRELRPGRGLLREIDGVATASVADWAGYGGAYPLVVDAATLEHATYTGHRCATIPIEADQWPTPALMLFERLCEGKRLDTCPQTSTANFPLRFRDPMIVRWSAEVPIDSLFFASSEDCGLVRPDTAARFVWSMKVFLRQLLSGITRLGDHSFERCPSIPTLHGSSLYPVDAAGAAVRDESYEQRLHTLLHDRAVLVGTDLFGAGDEASSPVHGILPGVYLHAMALDNLVRYGNRYWRSPWHPFWRVSGHRDALEVLALCILIFVFACIQTWVERIRPPKTVAGSFGAAITFGIVWLLFCGIIVVAVLRVSIARNESPINWLGILAVLGIPATRIFPRIWRNPNTLAQHSEREEFNARSETSGPAQSA